MENLLAHLVEVLAPKAVAQDALDVLEDVELLVRALVPEFAKVLIAVPLA